MNILGKYFEYLKLTLTYTMVEILSPTDILEEERRLQDFCCDDHTEEKSIADVVCTYVSRYFGEDQLCGIHKLLSNTNGIDDHSLQSFASSRELCYTFWLMSLEQFRRKGKALILSEYGTARYINTMRGIASRSEVDELFGQYVVDTTILTTCFEGSPESLARTIYLQVVLRAETLTFSEAKYADYLDLECNYDAADDVMTISGYAGSFKIGDSMSEDQRRALLQYFTDVSIVLHMDNFKVVTDSACINYVRSLRCTDTVFGSMKLYGDEARFYSEKMNMVWLLVLKGPYTGLYFIRKTTSRNVLCKFTGSAVPSWCAMYSTRDDDNCSNKLVDALNRYVNTFGCSWTSDEISRVMLLCGVDPDDAISVLDGILN